MCCFDFFMFVLIFFSVYYCVMYVLYSEYYGWLQNWLCGKLGCVVDVVDLVQDIFLCILFKCELCEIGMLCVFLWIIVCGLVIDYWCCEELQCVYFESIVYLFEVQVLLFEVWELVLELLEEILWMFDGFKLKVCIVFFLVQCEDFSYWQIVECMGVFQCSVECYVVEVLYYCYLLCYGE